MNITIDKAVLEQALKALIAYEVKVDHEWGMGRSIEQIDAAGDTPSEISALRNALAQPLSDDASPIYVLLAVEESIKNGECPWQIEQAFEEYESQRQATITKGTT